MLTKLVAFEDFDYRLGPKVGKLKNIVPAEIHAKIAKEGPVRWRADPWTMNSDYAHESAPRPIGTKQAAMTTAAQIEKEADRSFDDLIDALLSAPPDRIVYVDPAQPGGDMTAGVAYTHGSAEIREQGWGKGPKTATEIMMKMEAAAAAAARQRLVDLTQQKCDDALARLRKANSFCSGCGVGEGQKHFLHCKRL